MSAITQFCEICKQNKRLEGKIQRKKIGNNFFMTCPDCVNDINRTTQCMAISTEWMVKTMQNTYKKVGTIAVTQRA